MSEPWMCAVICTLACDKNDLCYRRLMETMPKKDLHAMHAEYGMWLNRVRVETNKFEDKNDILEDNLWCFQRNM